MSFIPADSDIFNMSMQVSYTVPTKFANPVINIWLGGDTIEAEFIVSLPQILGTQFPQLRESVSHNFGTIAEVVSYCNALKESLNVVSVNVTTTIDFDPLSPAMLSPAANNSPELIYRPLSINIDSSSNVIEFNIQSFLDETPEIIMPIPTFITDKSNGPIHIGQIFAQQLGAQTTPQDSVNVRIILQNDDDEKYD